MFLLRPPILAALALILAGCSHTRTPMAVAAAPVVAVLPEAPPPMSAINRDLSRAGQVWHLRVALNVAALACRGGAELQIIADYNGLLRTRTTELGTVQTALAAEFRLRGGDWRDAYDDAMTRLYNFFSQTQARDAFCATAAEVLAEARALPAAGTSELASFAEAKLPLLDAPFARMTAPRPAPVLAMAASAPVYAVAAPASPAAPRVRVDVAALGQ